MMSLDFTNQPGSSTTYSVQPTSDGRSDDAVCINITVAMNGKFSVSDAKLMTARQSSGLGTELMTRRS